MHKLEYSPTQVPEGNPRELLRDLFSRMTLWRTPVTFVEFHTTPKRTLDYCVVHFSAGETYINNEIPVSCVMGTYPPSKVLERYLEVTFFRSACHTLLIPYNEALWKSAHYT